MEMRWFYPGPAPRETRDWFAGLEGPVDDQPARQDLYLNLSEGDGLSVKLRLDRIEVKQRQAGLGPVRLNQRSRGHGEHWRKWSFVLLDTAAALEALVGPGGSWIEVRKARQLRRYRLEGQALRPLEPLAYVEAGCDLELAQVWLGPQIWWSLAFEAFGPEPELDHEFGACELVMDPGPPIALAPEHSYGYPRWLRDNAMPQE
jgi:hypothetical protein